jgi:hypothetical protein
MLGLVLVCGFIFLFNTGVFDYFRSDYSITIISCSEDVGSICIFEGYGVKSVTRAENGYEVIFENRLIP